MKQIKKLPFLLIPDAAEGVDTDPLNTNVNDVNTDFPVLPATWYLMKIASAKKETNKKQTGDNLVINFQLMEPAQDKRGEQVNPGFPIKQYISVTPTENYDTNAIKRSIATLAQKALVNATVRDIINNPSMLDGKVLKCKVKVNKETNEYPESNGIAGYEVAG